MDSTRLYKILGFTLVALSALIDLFIHFSGYYREIDTSVHFVIFIPFALGVVVLMVVYLKGR